MKTLKINVPDSVDKNEIKFHLAAILFEKGIFSSGQSAE